MSQNKLLAVVTSEAGLQLKNRSANSNKIIFINNLLSFEDLIIQGDSKDLFWTAKMIDIEYTL